MAEPEDENQTTSSPPSEETPQQTFANREEYLQEVVNLTTKMLGILEFEMVQSHNQGVLSPIDVAHFAISQFVLSKLQQGAAVGLEAGKPGLLLPNTQLVGKDGKPIRQA